MSKDLKTTVKEYAVGISEMELEHLTSRLTHRMSGDLPEALNRLSKNRGLDGVLSAAKSAEELFELCDMIRDILQQECRKKGLVLKKGPVAA